MIIKHTYRIFLFCLVIFSSGILYGQEKAKSILFVGNSYTYFWNLPQVVSAMAKTQGVQIVTRQSTAGGVTWKQHWDGDKGLETRALIENGEWDIVVLQNHSLSPFRNEDQFMEYGTKLADLVKKKGAKPVFYVTWARQANPLMQDQINQAYIKLAKETSGALVPVGPAWMQARQLLPELSLYDPDGTHPAPAGVYLTAALFYKFFTGQSVLGIPPRLTSIDYSGEKIYLSIMPDQEASFLLKLVENFNLNLLESD